MYKQVIYKVFDSQLLIADIQHFHRISLKINQLHENEKNAFVFQFLEILKLDN